MIKKIILSAVWLSFMLQITFAQNWMCRTIGSVGDDQGHSLVHTSDGGYVIAGQTNSFGAGGWDVYIVRLDSSGVMQWSRAVGGTGDEFGRSVVQCMDGGFAIAGSTNTFGQGSDDFYIVKLDGGGAIQWTKTIGGSGSDMAWEIVEANDSGFAIAGQTTSFGATVNDMYIVKLDVNGSLQWDRRVGQSTADMAFSIVQSPDGGFAVCGTTYTWTGSASTSSNDYYVVKLDSSGSLLWNNKIANPSAGNYYPDYARSIINTSDGGFMVVGEAAQPKGGGFTWDYYAVKLSGTGNIQWSSFYGGIGNGSSNNDEFAESVVQLPGNDYVILGTSASFGQVQDVYMIKIDANGNQLMTKVIGIPFLNEVGKSIVRTNSGSLAVAGYKYKYLPNGAPDEMFFVKTDSNLTTTCCWLVGGAPSPASPTLISAGTSGTAGGIAGTGGTASSGGLVNLNDCGLAPGPVASFTASDTAFCGGCIDFTDLSLNTPASWQWFFQGGVPDTSTQQNPSGICYTTPGNYDVMLIASNLNGSDTLTLVDYITVFPYPPPQSIQQTGDTLFAIPGASGYQWYYNGSLISGATNYYYVVSMNGDYNVVATDSNGCEVEAAIFNVIANVSEPAGNQALQLFPNPAEEFIVFSSDPDSYREGVTANSILIYDMMGEKVSAGIPQTSSNLFKRSQTVIDVSSLVPGMYLVEVTSAAKVYRAKFVKN